MHQMNITNEVSPSDPDQLAQLGEPGPDGPICGGRAARQHRLRADSARTGLGRGRRGRARVAPSPPSR